MKLFVACHGTYGELEVWFPLFLMSARDERSVVSFQLRRPSYSGRSRQYSLDRRLRGLQNRLEQFREAINPLLTPTVEQLLLSRSTCSLVTIPTELSQLEIGYL